MYTYRWFNDYVIIFQRFLQKLRILAQEQEYPLALLCRISRLEFLVSFQRKFLIYFLNSFSVSAKKYLRSGFMWTLIITLIFIFFSHTSTEETPLHFNHLVSVNITDRFPNCVMVYYSFLCHSVSVKNVIFNLLYFI
jgi:hypothetical protein